MPRNKLQIPSLWLLILGLANWRIASLFALEDGPFNIFERIRQLPGLQELLSCLWCTSVWTGFFLALTARKQFDIRAIMIMPFTLALSAVAIVIQQALLFLE